MEQGPLYRHVRYTVDDVVPLRDTGPDTPLFCFQEPLGHDPDVKPHRQLWTGTSSDTAVGVAPAIRPLLGL